MSAEDVREVLALFEQFDEVQLASKEKCLGVVLGVEVAAFPWEVAYAKFQARVRQVAAMPLHTRQRMLAYGLYAVSVFRFHAPVASVSRELLVAEQVAHAWLLRAPMRSLGPA